MAQKTQSDLQLASPNSEAMKTILIYSQDMSFCTSLLMLFEEQFRVTTTTDIEMLKNLISVSPVNLVIIDAPPSRTTEQLCRFIKLINEEIAIILLYVFRKQCQQWEEKQQSYVDAVFYKPFDITSVSKKVSDLLL
ncbi:MAG TPA: hypothetical protein VLY03_09285 [Bacteroidota bacterium]|nr:hypothetical protein [Bacteroidota bacterium]